MRLFIALNLDEAIRSQLSSTMECLKSQVIHGHFTNPDNLHLTLHFLGETERISQVCRAMDSIQSAPFPLTFDGIGRFRRPEGDIIWTGVRASDPLQNVHHQLNTALVAQGFTVENREYRPHLTLGRQVVLQNGWESIQQIVLPAMSMTVKGIHLMKSERINGELIYTSIFEHTL